MLALFPTSSGLSVVDADKVLYGVDGEEFSVRALAVRKSDQSIFGVVFGETFSAWLSEHNEVTTYEEGELPTLFGASWAELWEEMVTKFDYAWQTVRQIDNTSPYTLYTSLIGCMVSDRFARIDVKTRELIAQGFEYPADSGQMFSLSVEAQHTWTNMYVARDILSYPISVTSLDEQDDAVLDDASAVTAFYTAMVATARGHLDSGRALKNALRDAATVTEVDIITTSVDDR